MARNMTRVAHEFPEDEDGPDLAGRSEADRQAMARRMLALLKLRGNGLILEEPDAAHEGRLYRVGGEPGTNGAQLLQEFRRDAVEYLATMPGPARELDVAFAHQFGLVPSGDLDDPLPGSQN